MGGIALSASLHPRNTREVDLLIGIDGTDPDSLLAELERRHDRPIRTPALTTVGVDCPEIQLHVEAVTCEDLILFKLLAGRRIDEADVGALILANRDHIDYKYLRTWLSQNARVGRWGMCRRLAFPDGHDPVA